jgi:hypothetical protein
MKHIVDDENDLIRHDRHERADDSERTGNDGARPQTKRERILRASRRKRENRKIRASRVDRENRAI